LSLSEVKQCGFAGPSISGIRAMVNYSSQNCRVTCQSWKVERQPTLQAEHLSMPMRQPRSLWHIWGSNTANPAVSRAAPPGPPLAPRAAHSARPSRCTPGPAHPARPTRRTPGSPFRAATLAPQPGPAPRAAPGPCTPGRLSRRTPGPAPRAERGVGLCEHGFHPFSYLG
jgi:hypothetical protein